MEGVAGVKWVNSHPGNPQRHELPSVLGVYILSDAAAALPRAVMDGTLLTAFRTGAAGGVALDLGDALEVREELAGAGVVLTRASLATPGLADRLLAAARAKGPAAGETGKFTNADQDVIWFGADRYALPAGAVNTGVTGYLATVRLRASVAARGTFRIELQQNGTTTLLDSAGDVIDGWTLQAGQVQVRNLEKQILTPSQRE